MDRFYYVTAYSSNRHFPLDVVDLGTRIPDGPFFHACCCQRRAPSGRAGLRKVFCGNQLGRSVGRGETFLKAPLGRFGVVASSLLIGCCEFLGRFQGRNGKNSWAFSDGTCCPLTTYQHATPSEIPGGKTGRWGRFVGRKSFHEGHLQRVRGLWKEVAAASCCPAKAYENESGFFLDRFVRSSGKSRVDTAHRPPPSAHRCGCKSRIAYRRLGRAARHWKPLPMVGDWTCDCSLNFGNPSEAHLPLDAEQGGPRSTQCAADVLYGPRQSVYSQFS